MTTFAIQITPKLAKSRKPFGKVPVERVDFDAVYDFTKRYRVGYLIDGATDVVAVFSDLEVELELCERRESHDMTLCGYTVLIMEFDEAGATFANPITRGTRETGGIIGGPIAPDSVCSTFRSILSDVRAAIPRVAKG